MILFEQSLDGWRKSGVIVCFLLWSVTITLFSILGSGVRESRHLGQDAIVFQGNCTKAKRLNTALHLLINILSTALLASSNFFMQTLVAPTRQDIDTGHARHRWLEVAVPSFRNLRFIAAPKRVLWILLSLTSVPVHLFFNSCVFSTDVSTRYVGVLASQSFLHGGNYRNSSSGTLVTGGTSYSMYYDGDQKVIKYIAEQADGWETLSAFDCYSEYVWGSENESLLRTRRHVVVILERQDNLDGWNVSYSDGLNVTTSIWATYDCYQQVIPETYGPGTSGGHLRTSPFRDLDAYKSRPEYNSSMPGWPYIYNGGYKYGPLTAVSCKSEQVPEKCKVSFSNRLGLVVALFALSKCVICTATLVLLWKCRPLVTIGDVIESFMLKPDPTTLGMCTFGHQDFRSIHNSLDPGKKDQWQVEARKWIKRRKRWGSSVPGTSWMMAYPVCLVTWAVGIYLLSEGLKSQPLPKGEFGSSTKNYYIDSLNMTGNLTGASLLANLPQLCLSIAYFLLNGIYTRMHTGKEWSDMCTSYMPLRTSTPRGEQRATYFLQIPLIWGLSLQALSVLLHWMVSNSIYLVSEDTLPSDHITGQVSPRITVGYSSKAIIATLAVSTVVMILPIIVAMIPFKPQFPIVGNNSAAVSAACHSLADSGNIMTAAQEYESHDVGEQGSSYPLMSMHVSLLQGDQLWESSMKVLKRIKWGVIPGAGLYHHKIEGVDEMVGVEHLAFGTEDDGVQEVVDGSWYAGLQRLQLGEDKKTNIVISYI